MGAILNESASVSRQQRDETTPRQAREHAAWPRFSANASRHAEIGADGQPVAAAGLRNWTAGELAALLCEVLKREHAALAACHGQRVEADWIPLARSLDIRLSGTYRDRYLDELADEAGVGEYVASITARAIGKPGSDTIGVPASEA